MRDLFYLEIIKNFDCLVFQDIGDLLWVLCEY